MKNEVKFESSFQCFHRAFILNNCVYCGLSKNVCGDPATIPFRFIDPDFSLTNEAISLLRNSNLQRLLNIKKLHLILDLDHTLVHTRMIKKLKSKDRQSIKSLDDTFKFKHNGDAYVTKLRPGARDFVDQLSSMFELSVFTLGTRKYAHRVVKKLRAQSKLLWVITKEDCLEKKRKTLDIVLSHQQVVLIVDDTLEVWEESCKANLVKIDRYEFFPMKEGKDEIMDIELTRVLNVLRLAHSAFYDGNLEFDCGNDYGARDVRKVLDLISTNSIILDGDRKGLGLWSDQEDMVGEGTEGSSTESRKRLGSDSSMEAWCQQQKSCVPEEKCKTVDFME